LLVILKVRLFVPFNANIEIHRLMTQNFVTFCIYPNNINNGSSTKREHFSIGSTEGFLSGVGSGEISGVLERVDELKNCFFEVFESAENKGISLTKMYCYSSLDSKQELVSTQNIINNIIDEYFDNVSISLSFDGIVVFKSNRKVI